MKLCNFDPPLGKYINLNMVIDLLDRLCVTITVPCCLSNWITKTQIHLIALSRPGIYWMSSNNLLQYTNVDLKSLQGFLYIIATHPESVSKTLFLDYEIKCGCSFLECSSNLYINGFHLNISSFCELDATVWENIKPCLEKHYPLLILW